MVGISRLPAASEVWAKIPLPAMTEEVLRMEKAGLHVFRLLQSKDLQGNTTYGVECRDILGFATEFTDDFTELGIEHEGEAKALYNLGKSAAKSEYKRLERRMKENGRKRNM